MRFLSEHGLEQGTRVLEPPARAQELVALGVPPECNDGLATLERGAWVQEALEGEQRRSHEEERAHERRDRVPGQAEDECRAPHSEGQRLPRLDGHSPEDFPDAELRLDSADEVVRPDRNAPRRHEHVAVEPLRHRLAMRVFLVGDDRQKIDCGARAREGSGDHRAVRLEDLPRRERVSGGTQLAPGGEHRDAGAAGAADLGNSRGRERADLRRTQAYVRPDDRVSCTHVAPAWTNVGIGACRLCDLDFPPALDGLLDRHDGVRALRNCTSGRDRSGRSSRQRLWRRAACGHPNDDGKRPRSVRRAYGVAVHRGARERRKVDPRHRRLGQNPADGVAQRHRLRRKRPCVLEDLLERLLQR